MVNNTPNGEAYGFFYYSGESKRISEAIADIRERTKVPSEVSLELIEGVGNLDTKGDSELVKIVQRESRERVSHVLKATLPGMGNRRAANVVGNILNGVYMKLYAPTEDFYAGIAYKRGEQYVYRHE